MSCNCSKMSLNTALLIFSSGAMFFLWMSCTATASPAPIAAAYEERLRLLTKAYRFCAQENSTPTSYTGDNAHTSIAGGLVRCMATNMGLWSDAEGYNAKRVAKFFIKEGNENEVMALVDHCNRQHQQADLDLWAQEAYRCATAGLMGTWLEEYIFSANI